MQRDTRVDRRRWLHTLAAASLGSMAAPWVQAARRMTTPAQAEGPFYPLRLPLDQDNDLTRVQGRDGQAHGEIIDVTGQLLDEDARPLSGVQLEIWQVNGHGRYHHPHDDQDKPLDPNFQGFGKTVTAADGSYRFRTVRPVAYPGRAPHIHFAVVLGRTQRFYTQMYLEGASENASDFLFRRLLPDQQRSLLVAFRKDHAGDPHRVGRFDIVLGKTMPSDNS